VSTEGVRWVESKPLPCAVCGERVLRDELFLIVRNCITEFVHDATPIQAREGVEVRQEPVHLICIQNPAKIRPRVIAVGRKTTPPE